MMVNSARVRRHQYVLRKDQAGAWAQLDRLQANAQAVNPLPGVRQRAGVRLRSG
jgi:hypothetical protein